MAIGRRVGCRGNRLVQVNINRIQDKSYTGEQVITDNDKTQSGNTEKEWLRQYGALATRFDEVYQSAKEHGREAMNTALDKAKGELVATQEFTAERGEQLRRYLVRDLDQTAASAPLREIGLQGLPVRCPIPSWKTHKVFPPCG